VKEEYDWEVYEMFKDQLEREIPTISLNISLLREEKDISEIVNQLFRNFHTYKSLSAYLNLLTLNKLVSKTEIVLSSLRDKKETLQESIIEWLESISKQLTLYFDEMQNNCTNLSELPPLLLSSIEMTQEYINPTNILKTLSILYMD